MNVLPYALITQTLCAKGFSTASMTDLRARKLCLSYVTINYQQANHNPQSHTPDIQPVEVGLGVNCEKQCT